MNKTKSLGLFPSHLDCTNVGPMALDFMEHVKRPMTSPIHSGHGGVFGHSPASPWSLSQPIVPQHTLANHSILSSHVTSHVLAQCSPGHPVIPHVRHHDLSPNSLQHAANMAAYDLQRARILERSPHDIPSGSFVQHNLHNTVPQDARNTTSA